MSCRLCNKNEQLIDLFNIQLDKGEQLRYYILLSTGINIKENDQLPKYVCFKCCKIAIEQYRYRLSVTNNDKFLQENLGEVYKPPITDQNELCRLGLQILSKNQLSPTTITTFMNSAPFLHQTFQNSRDLFKHVSIQNLLSQYPNLKIPKNIYLLDVAPVVTLDESEINCESHKLKLLQERFCNISVSRVTKSDSRSNTSKSDEIESNCTVSYEDLLSQKCKVTGLQTEHINQSQEIKKSNGDLLKKKVKNEIKENFIDDAYLSNINDSKKDISYEPIIKTVTISKTSEVVGFQTKTNLSEKSVKTVNGNLFNNINEIPVNNCFGSTSTNDLPGQSDTFVSSNDKHAMKVQGAHPPISDLVASSSQNFIVEPVATVSFVQKNYSNQPIVLKQSGAVNLIQKDGQNKSIALPSKKCEVAGLDETKCTNSQDHTYLANINDTPKLVTILPKSATVGLQTKNILDKNSYVVNQSDSTEKVNEVRVWVDIIDLTDNVSSHTNGETLPPKQMLVASSSNNCNDTTPKPIVIPTKEIILPKNTLAPKLVTILPKSAALPIQTKNILDKNCYVANKTDAAEKVNDVRVLVDIIDLTDEGSIRDNVSSHKNGTTFPKQMLVASSSKNCNDTAPKRIVIPTKEVILPKNTLAPKLVTILPKSAAIGLQIKNILDKNSYVFNQSDAAEKVNDATASDATIKLTDEVSIRDNVSSPKNGSTLPPKLMLVDSSSNNCNGTTPKPIVISTKEVILPKNTLAPKLVTMLPKSAAVGLQTKNILDKNSYVLNQSDAVKKVNDVRVSVDTIDLTDKVSIRDNVSSHKNGAILSPKQMLVASSSNNYNGTTPKPIVIPIKKVNTCAPKSVKIFNKVALQSENGGVNQSKAAQKVIGNLMNNGLLSQQDNIPVTKSNVSFHKNSAMLIEAPIDSNKPITKSNEPKSEAIKVQTKPIYVAETQRDINNANTYEIPTINSIDQSTSKVYVNVVNNKKKSLDQTISKVSVGINDLHFNVVYNKKTNENQPINLPDGTISNGLVITNDLQGYNVVNNNGIGSDSLPQTSSNSLHKLKEETSIKYVPCAKQKEENTENKKRRFISPTNSCEVQTKKPCLSAPATDRDTITHICTLCNKHTCDCFTLRSSILSTVKKKIIVYTKINKDSKLPSNTEYLCGICKVHFSCLDLLEKHSKICVPISKLQNKSRNSSVDQNLPTVTGDTNNLQNINQTSSTSKTKMDQTISASKSDETQTRSTLKSDSNPSSSRSKNNQTNSISKSDINQFNSTSKIKTNQKSDRSVVETSNSHDVLSNQHQIGIQSFWNSLSEDEVIQSLFDKYTSKTKNETQTFVPSMKILPSGTQLQLDFENNESILDFYVVPVEMEVLKKVRTRIKQDYKMEPKRTLLCWSDIQPICPAYAKKSKICKTIQNNQSSLNQINNSEQKSPKTSTVVSASLNSCNSKLITRNLNNLSTINSKPLNQFNSNDSEINSLPSSSNNVTIVNFKQPNPLSINIYKIKCADNLKRNLKMKDKTCLKKAKLSLPNDPLVIDLTMTLNQPIQEKNSIISTLEANKTKPSLNAPPKILNGLQEKNSSIISTLEANKTGLSLNAPPKILNGQTNFKAISNKLQSIGQPNGLQLNPSKGMRDDQSLSGNSTNNRPKNSNAVLRVKPQWTLC